MAPLDRAEHRQQRMRGAGVANVQTNFSFNLGALSRPAKQPSLPPPLPQSRTPVVSAPRGQPGSVERHGSATVKRSAGRIPSKTPPQRIVTPQLGKRKRGSNQAEARNANDVDELSPEHHLENPTTVEKARRVSSTVSPVHEEGDDMLDELSVLDVHPHESPASIAKTPMANHSGSPKINTAVSIMASGKRGLSEPAPVTPINSGIRKQSLGREVEHAAQEREGDTLRSGHLQPDSDNPHSASHKSGSGDIVLEDEADELSPELSIATSLTSASKSQAIMHQSPSITSQKDLKSRAPRKRGRPRKTRTHEQEEEDVVQSTPALDTPRRIQRESVDVVESHHESEADPEHEDEEHAQTAQAENEDDPARTVRVENEEDTAHVAPPESPGSNTSDRQSDDTPLPQEFDDEQQESDGTTPIQRRTPIRRARSPVRKKAPAKRVAERPPKKRAKTGPSQIIHVMRLKGFALNALTVVDTTRNLMEEWTTHRINKMTEQLANVKDGSRAKLLRHHRNVILAFRDQLEDDLLELQDVNDTGIDNTKKLKQFSSESKRLRKEYFQLQRDREQIALETDEITEGFMEEKKNTEARHSLSSSLYDIQAAIQSGKERARAEGREDEGPELPLTMLVENAAVNFGQTTGLLGKIKNFNGFLGRAAGLLEGKVRGSGL